MKPGPLRKVIRTERRCVEVKRSYRLCYVLECGHAVVRDSKGAGAKRSRCRFCVVAAVAA